MPEARGPHRNDAATLRHSLRVCSVVAPMNDSPTPAAPAQVRKFPCPQCGADIVWSPGAKKLRCRYCGYERAIQLADDPKVRERPLEEELSRKRDLGWGMERKSYRCAHCGAVTTFAPGVAAGHCAFCGAPAVVEAPARAELVRPDGVVPFAVPRDTALGRFRAWLGSLWFRPNDLRKRAQLDSIRGIYVPFWFFDAATLSQWSAEAGYRRAGGRNSEMEWRPASGTLDHFFDDLPVPGSTGLDLATSERLEPFPTADMAPYDPSYLSGFAAEEYGRPLRAAWQLGRARMEETLREACRAEVPGDACRNLRVETTWSALATKSGLLPLWISAYHYRGKSFRYVVNGATGRATGSAPWSWWKIGLAIALALLVVWFISQH